MSSHCQHCHRGKQYGHKVSHAKNRLNRIFFPNLQKLKVLKNGLAVRVVFCAGCIKRLKKDGKIGLFSLWKYKTAKVATSPVMAKEGVKKEIKAEKKVKEEKKAKKPTLSKKEKAKTTLKIEDIVGKKS